MTHADMIRQMDNDELVNLLVWRSYGYFEYIPECSECCEDYGGGCAVNCPHEKRERAVRNWLESEVEE